MGALVLAALFGNVAMLVANFNLSRTRLQEKMDQVGDTPAVTLTVTRSTSRGRRYACRYTFRYACRYTRRYAWRQVNESMKSAGLPVDLANSVRQFYIYSWARHKNTSANSYVQELSPGGHRVISESCDQLSRWAPRNQRIM